MRRTVLAAATLVALAALHAAPAAAGRRPSLDLQLGSTAAIGGGVKEGGLAASLGLLWPVAAGVSSGVEFGADDFGTSTRQLRDPNDGTDLGTVAGVHREALSACWRIDGAVPAWHGFVPWGTAGWGFYRVRDDHFGNETARVNTAGITAGAGIRRSVGASIALGAVAHWHRVFDEAAGRWVSVGVDLAWK